MGRRSGQDRGTCIAPGLRSAFLPSAAAVALYLLAAIPLALLPPPNAWAGISEGPDATFCICWGWGRVRGSRSCVQAFSITPCSHAGRPSPKVLVCSAVFLTGPQIHIKMTDALSISLLRVSPPGADGRCRSRWRGLLRRRCGARCDASGCCGWALPVGTQF